MPVCKLHSATQHRLSGAREQQCRIWPSGLVAVVRDGEDQSGPISLDRPPKWHWGCTAVPARAALHSPVHPPQAGSRGQVRALRGDSGTPKMSQISPWHCCFLWCPWGDPSPEPHFGLTLPPWHPKAIGCAPRRPHVRRGGDVLPPLCPPPSPPFWHSRGVPSPSPLPMGVPPRSPAGDKGSAGTGAFPKGDTAKHPADLSCNLGLAKPRFIFRSPGGEARRKATCDF